MNNANNDGRMFILLKNSYHLLHISRDYTITIFFPFNSNMCHFSSLCEKDFLVVMTENGLSKY